jgi:hypothetical protein
MGVRSGRRTRIGGQFAPRLIEMLRSPAYRVLSLSARRVLDRVEIELGHHGGNDNGRLPVTYDNFVSYGIERHAIAPAIREAIALGLLEVTERGCAGNAESRTPAIQTGPSAATYGGSIVGAEPRFPNGSLVNDAEVGMPPEFRDVVDVPPSWLAGVARLDRQGIPREVLPHRWRLFVLDCTRFVLSPDGWARRAADLGWDAFALFGCSRRSPLMYLGCAGLLWIVGGGRIVRLHVDWAEIQPPANGSPRTYHRRRVSPELIMLPWLMR